MTGPEKGYYLHQAVRYVTAHQIPGAIVECGVWRGGSMLTVAHTLPGSARRTASSTSSTPSAG